MEQQAEQAWIEQAKQGDEAAFGRLVTQYQRKVFAFVLGMVKDTTVADELTQTTFLKVWKSLPGFRAESAFQTWLFQIALNSVRSWGRWQKIRLFRERSLDASVGQTEDEAPSLSDRQVDRRVDADPTRRSASAEDKQRINRAVESLPPREKEVFMLRHFQDLSMKEIGEAMGIAEGSVKAHLFHALEKLRKALEEHDHDHDHEL
jgi:RNA polymerase sigma-70 factor (ECF subfamily)